MMYYSLKGERKRKRLLEAHQRGMWNASEESVNKLKKIYMEMEGDLEDLG
jgi:cobaltochelatase CobN